MRIAKVLSALLLGSTISLSLGGILLYAYNQVPIFLINLTLAAIVVLFILAYFVSKRNIIAVDVSTILGILAPVLSLSTPAHIQILTEFGQNWLASADGVLQFLGFYAFPITFVILRIAYYKRLRRVPAHKIEATDSEKQIKH